jgi:hypothetical protein
MVVCNFELNLEIIFYGSLIEPQFFRSYGSAASTLPMILQLKASDIAEIQRDSPKMHCELLRLIHY